MAPNHGEISALVTLITDASKIVEQYYAKSAVPRIPSLNDTESHPLDDVIHDADLRNAAQIVEGACVQLMATVARPNQTIINVSHNFVQYPFSLFFLTYSQRLMEVCNSQHHRIPTMCLHILRDMNLAV